MKQFRIVLAVQMVLLMSLLSLGFACKTSSVATTPGKPRDENLIKIALATREVAATVKAGIGVKRALLEDKLITQEQSAVFTGILIKVTQANDQLAKRSLEFDTFTGGKADLIKLFEELVSATSELAAGGTLKLPNTLAAALAGLPGIIDSLKPLFQ